jgi:UDP-N-acetylglucosamine 2-epimerase (non-hydrolysing)
MKIAPVMRALHEDGRFDPILVHTGQHYDALMSGTFLDELGIEPDEHLGVGPASEAVQFAEIVKRLEPVMVRRSPDVVIVVGDVTSTLAAGLAASMQGIPIAHVEAGLRSRDWSMPEERNRVVVDRLSRFCFTPSEDANENLLLECFANDRI